MFIKAISSWHIRMSSLFWIISTWNPLSYITSWILAMAINYRSYYKLFCHSTHHQLYKYDIWGSYSTFALSGIDNVWMAVSYEFQVINLSVDRIWPPGIWLSSYVDCNQAHSILQCMILQPGDNPIDNWSMTLFMYIYCLFHKYLFKWYVSNSCRNSFFTFTPIDPTSELVPLYNMQFSNTCITSLKYSRQFLYTFEFNLPYIYKLRTLIVPKSIGFLTMSK